MLSIFKIKTVKKFDLQFYILVLSAILLQLVIQFENILYLNNLTGVFRFHISNSLVMVILISGLIGYFGYHIYLLSIEDFPVPPLSVVLVMSGFTLGTIIVSVQIDLSNPCDQFPMIQ